MVAGKVPEHLRKKSEQVINSSLDYKFA
jgi:hypothetical protein